jgi:hypothetical protein
MKPVERKSSHDLYVVMQRTSLTTAMYALTGVGNSLNGTSLGTGIYDNYNDAEKEQTIQLLKGNKVEIFHLEYPI